jgi:polar amino acid transport system substrate-binding protein
MASSELAAVVKELAPSGKLRVGLNYSNFLLTKKGATDADAQGVAADLGRALAGKLNVPVEFVGHPGAGELAEAVRKDAWDVAFLGAEPARAKEIAFTAAYLEIPSTYLVPAGSKIESIADVDRTGIRISVSEKSAYDLYLSRNLKHAQLVRSAGLDASYDTFVKQKLEVLAGLKPRLLQDAAKLPGSRILDGTFTSIQQAIGTPVARQAGAKFLREFVEEAKKSGLVARAIERNGVRGVNVAPMA